MTERNCKGHAREENSVAGPFRPGAVWGKGQAIGLRPESSSGVFRPCRRLIASVARWPAQQIIAAQIDCDIGPGFKAVMPNQIALRGQPLGLSDAGRSVKLTERTSHLPLRAMLIKSSDS